MQSKYFRSNRQLRKQVSELERENQKHLHFISTILGSGIVSEKEQSALRANLAQAHIENAELKRFVLMYRDVTKALLEQAGNEAILKRATQLVNSTIEIADK